MKKWIERSMKASPSGGIPSASFFDSIPSRWKGVAQMTTIRRGPTLVRGRRRRLALCCLHFMLMATFQQKFAMINARKHNAKKKEWGNNRVSVG